MLQDFPELPREWELIGCHPERRFLPVALSSLFSDSRFALKPGDVCPRSSGRASHNRCATDGLEIHDTVVHPSQSRKISLVTNRKRESALLKYIHGMTRLQCLLLVTNLYM